MKSQSIEWSRPEPRESVLGRDAAHRLADTLTLGGKVFRAVVPALALITAAAWVIAQPALVLYLQVSMCLSGFVFLALALDSLSARRGALLVISGLAMFALAGFSTGEALELLVVGAAVSAVWLGFAIFDQKAQERAWPAPTESSAAE